MVIAILSKFIHKSDPVVSSSNLSLTASFTSDNLLLADWIAVSVVLTSFSAGLAIVFAAPRGAVVLANRSSNSPPDSALLVVFAVPRLLLYNFINKKHYLNHSLKPQELVIYFIKIYNHKQ